MFRSPQVIVYLRHRDLFAGSASDFVGMSTGVFSGGILRTARVCGPQRGHLPGHRGGHERHSGWHPAALHHHEEPLTGAVTTHMVFLLQCSVFLYCV